METEWKSQGYRWTESSGMKKERGGDVIKRHFNIQTPTSDPKRGDTRFQMNVWLMPNHYPNTAIIQFIGDTSIAVDFPHRNSKKENPRPYHMTEKSTLREIEKSSDFPAMICRQMRADTAPDIASQVSLS